LVGNRKLITPGVRAIIRNKQGQVLLVRRKDNGQWVMPAGSIELEESILDCVKREVREETGLEVISAIPIAMYTEPRFSFTTAYGAEQQMFAIVFLVKEWSGEVLKQTEETDDARFFSLSELPAIPPLYQETLQDLQSYTGLVIVK